MAHWIVTHNPHLNPDPHGWNVFLKSIDEKGSIPVDGDFVLFYETEAPFKGRRGKGRKGIVRSARVKGSPVPMSGLEGYPYQVKCETNRECFLPLDDAWEIVKRPFYRRNLTPISGDEFRRIERAAAKG